MLTPEDVVLLLSAVTVLCVGTYYLWCWVEYYLEIRRRERRFRERYWHEQAINRERLAVRQLGWAVAVCRLRGLLHHYAVMVCRGVRWKRTPRTRR